MSPWGHTPSAIEHTSSSPCSETHQCGFSRLLPERNVTAETVAGQAVCMKLAYAICLKEPELMGELEAYLENMEPEYYTAAVQCARNNILKKIRK